jgi:hypothetical protein
MAKVIPLEELAYRRALQKTRAEMDEIRRGKTGKLTLSDFYTPELIKLLRLQRENRGRKT